MSWQVYLWRLNGQPIYVGITSRSVAIRAGKNMSKYKGQPKFWSVIKENLPKNFDYEIICSGLPKRRALDMEQELIDRYNLIENGCNSSRNSFEVVNGGLTKFQKQYISNLKSKGFTPEQILRRLGI